MKWSLYWRHFCFLQFLCVPWMASARRRAKTALGHLKSTRSKYRNRKKMMSFFSRRTLAVWKCEISLPARCWDLERVWTWRRPPLLFSAITRQLRESVKFLRSSLNFFASIFFWFKRYPKLQTTEGKNKLRFISFFSDLHAVISRRWNQLN